MQRDLIVFGEDWGGLPSSTQHLVRYLAQQRQVLWINSIGLRQPHLGKADFCRIWRKLTSASKPSATSANQTETSSCNSNIVQLNPLTWPAPRSMFARKLSSKILQKQIQQVQNKMELHRPILWISLPTAVDMIGKLEESAVVYYCGDDFSALAGVDHDVVGQRERELVESADLILAASDVLAKRFPSDKTHLIPHGVDYELFSQTVDRAHDLPDDGRPIAGFYGSIAEWFDLKLVQSLAKRLPEWHFVLIGKADIDISSLSGMSNVHLLGPRPHQVLPSYSQHWTASLLPFKNNDQIQACNPLKLREYLAAGRPVISTAYPAALVYQDTIAICSTEERFVYYLEQANKTTSSQPALQAVVREDTWEARAQQINQLLEQL